ncbi:MAG: hypothetical protein DRQ64_00090 [Gammaproteobacteria bacterium]|nr:MAG: hypothetical protein DRQ64_00090 [Gammaproteobacteria bacterium]
MASFDRQFEVVRPSLDKLTRMSLEVADGRLLDPSNTAVVPFIDGEFAQEDATYKWVRAADFARPSSAILEWRGDTGVQASRKLSVLRVGGYEADTIVFDPALTTLGAAVQVGVVNNAASGSVNRAGLIASGGGLILGYITRVSASNGGRLRFLQTQV